MEAVLEDKPYVFRGHREEDLNFIQSSWGSSYYSGHNGNQLLAPEEFHSYHRPIREKILAKPNVAIIVCCGLEDKDQILGYSIIEKPESPCLILHYIYMKQVYKGEKLGWQLLRMSCPQRPVLYTHSTVTAGKIINKLKSRGREDLERFLFVPHLI